MSTTVVTRTVNTLAELRAHPPLSESAIYELRGRATPGDGGGGVFLWDPVSTAADDGGYVVKVGDVATGRWVRDLTRTRFFDIRWYGAVSGVSTDQSSYIQAAIDAAAAHPDLHIVYIPSGTWTYDSPVYLEDDITIIGDGPKASILKRKAASAKTGDNQTCIFAVEKNRVTLRDFGIDGNVDNQTFPTPGHRVGADGFYFVGNVVTWPPTSYDLTIQNVESSENGLHGVVVEGCERVKILDCEFNNNGAKTEFQGPGIGLQFARMLQDVQILRCKAYGNVHVDIESYNPHDGMKAEVGYCMCDKIGLATSGSAVQEISAYVNIHDNIAHQISVIDWSDVRIEGNLLEMDTLLEHLSISPCHPIYVANTECTPRTGSNVWTRVCRSVIRNNRIISNVPRSEIVDHIDTYIPISLQGDIRNSVIDGNVVEGWAAGGVWLFTAGDPTTLGGIAGNQNVISNNQFSIKPTWTSGDTDAIGNGIFLRDAYNNIVTDNVVRGCNVGIVESVWSYTAESTYVALQNTIKNNDIKNCYLMGDQGQWNVSTNSVYRDNVLNYSDTTAYTSGGELNFVFQDRLILVDSTSGGFTLWMDAYPRGGNVITVVDIAGKCGTNPVTIGVRNLRGATATIGGQISAILSGNYESLTIKYHQPTARWMVV